MHTTGPSLSGVRLVLAVTGSIAAYKAVSLLRLLRREAATVNVVMTAGACRFVTPLTFEVLSGAHVATDLFEAHQEMLHLSLPEQAQAIVIAPATANCLAKAALGLADDLLSTMLLTTQCPVIFAPAMDGDMWQHPTVVEHVATLRARGAIIVEPEDGPLASGRQGQGRLADEERILAAVHHAVHPRRDWSGRKVLISAGPTQEAIDPVRFLSNRSSGKMGYALAEAARARGADVVLVSGPTSIPVPAGVEYCPVITAEEMHKALTTQLDWSDTVIMAAAVADFRPARPSAHKIKKRRGPVTHLDLEATDDILCELRDRRTSQVLVGFAAETDDLLAHAKEKLHAKGLDLLVANDVTAPGSGFGSDTNRVWLLAREADPEELPLLSKRDVADRILDRILTVHTGR
ncbi:MAG TPA: bifunctional phosphopantothenoylcysteine decarboxylase/phosphopantothenate--cysteine ligase CoaBC [Nitrospira sp.]|nr:bifunctional phosphopantothenoylcysteine decarboxylase/phosphopantothenate--cysteine ligase CoaBC [Nitrospira sp.]HMW85713.1 bifunctional phosphopantothenoylcysteine decarboxylase/phosphopantothenate--cysteine ligase CoaBC [Nitrospira sp.]HMX91780.1 bifunctional phosphopantothenoylcysteine decarboxylase/phosphopantothenate--cysteine ligase CoaBC [Nitrospira sp.]HNE31994.1 bifunctional phosphopantothenoylcysteine decarboxylase/phosphopantothenate--cysteine ligase CoaBC [Nitrospira sp.]HNM1766